MRGGVRDLIIPGGAVGGGGLTNINVSAGTTSNNLSNIVFANSPTVTFGLNGSTITASAVGGGGGLTNIRVSAGTTSNLLSALTFADGNGISFGINASTITASHNALTSQSNQAVSGSNGSFAFQTVTFGALNGFTFYTSNGSLVGSYTVPSQSVQTLGGYFLGNTTGESSSSTWDARTLSIRGDGIISVGWSLGSMRISATVPAQTNQTLGLYMSSNTTSSVSSGTVDARSMTFRGMGIASVGYSGGEVVISVPAGGGAGDGVNIIAAGTQTADTTGTVVFSNSNNVTFGMQNSSIVTASVTVATSLTNIRVSAGTTSNLLSALTFADSNGVSFGLDASTITASISTYTMGTYMNQQPADVTTAAAPGQNSVWFAPMRIPAYLSASTGLIGVEFTGTVTSNQTNTVGATLRLGLYKATGTQFTNYATTFTTSFGFTFWNSGTASVSYSYNVTSGSSNGSNLMTASVYGHRILTFNIGSVLDPGLYGWGYVLSTSSAGNSSIMRSINVFVNAPFLGTMGFVGSAGSGSLGFADAGTYSATSAAMPATIGISNVAPISNIVPLIKIGAY